MACGDCIPAVPPTPTDRDLGLSPVRVVGGVFMAMAVPAVVGPSAGARIAGTGGHGVRMRSTLVFASCLGLPAAAPPERFLRGMPAPWTSIAATGVHDVDRLLAAAGAGHRHRPAGARPAGRPARPPSLGPQPGRAPHRPADRRSASHSDGSRPMPRSSGATAHPLQIRRGRGGPLSGCRHAPRHGRDRPDPTVEKRPRPARAIHAPSRRHCSHAGRAMPRATERHAPRACRDGRQDAAGSPPDPVPDNPPCSQCHDPAQPLHDVSCPVGIETAERKSVVARYSRRTENRLERDMHPRLSAARRARGEAHQLPRRTAGRTRASQSADRRPERGSTWSQQGKDTGLLRLRCTAFSARHRASRSMTADRCGMLIGIEKRFIFVANTKSASSAVEQLLAPHAELRTGDRPALKHRSMRGALQKLDFLFGDPRHPPESFFKSGIMRDPIARIHS